MGDTMDRLFLELAHHTSAMTMREVRAAARVEELERLLRDGLNTHAKTPRESLDRWHRWADRVNDALDRGE